MKKRFISLITYIYIFTLFVIYPLICGKSYTTLGDIKFYSFFTVSLFFFLLVCRTEIGAWLRPDDLMNAGKNKKTKTVGANKTRKRLCITDGLVIIYLLLVFISYLNAEDKSSTLWGFDGWYMGLYMQVLMVAIYFVIRVAFVMCTDIITADRKVILRNAILISSVIVMLIGIVQSYGIDAFGLYSADSYDYRGLFFSTMGQTSWYSGYLSFVVVYSLYVNFVDLDKKLLKQTLSLLHLLIAIIALVRLGADAAYGATAVATLCLIWIIWEKRGWSQSVRKVVFGVLIIIAFIVAGFVVLNSTGVFGEPVKGPGGMFFFDNYWGNRRGVIWKHTIDIFRGMGIEGKLFGAGPDNYYAVSLLTPADDLHSIMANSITVCAHNEWLNALICYGVFGVVAYLGIFVVSMVKAAGLIKDKQTCALAFMLICVYIFHDTFTYQQYYTSPMIFVVMAVVSATFLNRKKEPDMVKS